MKLISTQEYSSVPIFAKNFISGYEANLLQRMKNFKEKKQINPVHEIVDFYFKQKGQSKMPSSFYKGRNAYPKMAREAKKLLEMCDNVLDDALWCVQKMHYIANRNDFDWSISTCMKYDLLKIWK